jgi:hypothetical protein
MINSLPPAMRAALQSASSPVEFDKLTDDFVISDACRRLQFKYGVLSDPQNPSADSRQSFLSETEYLEACRRWLQALKLYHEDIYPIWKQLYDGVWFGSEIPTRPFDERKEYDILLRATALPVGRGKPAWHYANLWAQTERIVAKRKTDEAANKTNALEAQLAEVKRIAAAAAVASTTGSSSRPSNNDSSSKKATTGQGFRGSSKEKQAFCFACGSNSHTAAQCDATRKAVGNRGNLFIRKEGSDWIIPGVTQDRKRICYPWNLPAGCRFPRSCGKGQHICSLCGSSSHGAPSCSA